ncbi:hypothetical protein CCHL11_04658 [Colletotrichum chlorophyti]|uniref:ABM domain-containing protein n=1 Tax=Colletotrichum chlorophyti TaxID=708187 RepID=A0A1Q8RRE3_9PEZI|nr:hypothetical protein CCHL11_04658 [Colletotrichum chlorophyti]
MVVTELALMQLKEPMTEETKELMDYCQTVQDTWVLRRKPGLPPARLDRGTAVLQQVEDPRVLLFAAQWDSPQAHGEWLASPESENVIGKLMPHVHTEGPRGVVVFHVDEAIFGTPAPADAVSENSPAAPTTETVTGANAEEEADTGTESKGKEPEAPVTPAPAEKSKAEGKKKAEDEPPALLTAPVLSVGRFGVRSERKEEFLKKYAEVKWVVEEHSKPFPVRGGWRIEKAAEDLDEFVMYCGWSSVEQHKAIAQHEGFKEWAGIQEFVTGTDIWHYQRIL